MNLLAICSTAFLLHASASDNSGDADIIAAPEESDFSAQAEEREKEENIQSDPPNVISDDTSNVQPPTTLIFVCEGTAQTLSFCQFPFTTLAGNEYTRSCADKVEDNPDYSVDRPWCFTSATEWGFCDCNAFFDFTYVISHNAQLSSKRDITVQIKMTYPGTAWCSLWSDDTYLPPMSAIEQGQVSGAVVNITRDMIVQDINGQVDFSVPLEQVKTHPHLTCQASIPGLPTNPNPVSTTLGTKKDMLEDPSDSSDTSQDKPRLVTRTSGALMYSTLILMTLAGFFFYRYAMDRRIHILKFIQVSQDDTVNKPLSQAAQ